MRRSLAWAVAVPLILAGSQAAHALAYRLVYPDLHLRTVTLLSTGHGYLTWLPVALAVGGAAALASLGATALDAVRGGSPRPLPAAAFALLPPLAFALQELLELSLHTGTFAWHALLAPTFLPGLLLQAPFALASYAAARLLLRAAEQAGLALRPQAVHARAATTVSFPQPRRASLPRRRVASSRLAKRGPPSLVAA
ncbi:MAG: hypothetical protein ACXVZL_08195 [Gaiellaceae bacterium]